VTIIPSSFHEQTNCEAELLLLLFGDALLFCLHISEGKAALIRRCFQRELPRLRLQIHAIMPRRLINVGHESRPSLHGRLRCSHRSNIDIDEHLSAEIMTALISSCKAGQRLRFPACRRLRSELFRTMLASSCSPGGQFATSY